MKPAAKEVTVQQLDNRMVIRAYTGFNMKFQHMGEEICRWLRHNFKGTQAIVHRDGQKKQLLVDKIKNGDTLSRLFQFPENKKKLIIVTPNLIRELENRGFINFIVVIRPKPTTPSLERHKVTKDSVNQLVEKVKESVSLREKATDAVENVMDSGRKGKVKSEDVIGFVEDISKNSSAEAMSALVSLKESDQTYAHCVDVGSIFETAYYGIKELVGEKSIFKNKKEAMMASFLHDFGKSKIPKDILDSHKRFDRDGPEMKMMLAHPVRSAELLEEMGLPAYIINMAHYHHVKLNTSMKSSYPSDVNYDDVMMETRLLAIVDIYQALVGKRSYKKSWSPPSAVRYLDALAGVEFDLDTWDNFLQVNGRYPKSSLVELSDDSIGFVMNVPKEDLERPQIVVVRNSAGEDLKNTPLIDLETQKDLSIVKDLDAQDVFGERALDIFLGINAV